MTTKRKAKAIPKGYEGVTPYISIKGASKAIDFYKKAFGAKEVHRMTDGGKVVHADIQIGGAHVMLADEFPEIRFRSPQTLGGSPVILFLYVEDVDAFVAKAVATGAKLTRPIENKPHGDRAASLTDPFGHTWTFATHVEDVPAEKWMGKGGS